MLIGIVSDTHSNEERFRKVLDILSDCDMIIHCGDWTNSAIVEMCRGLDVHGVHGNCDFNLKGPVKFHEPYIDLEIDGIRIGACHGHDSRLPELLEAGFDVVCSGHTHHSKIEMVDGTLHINPGSPAKPRNGASCAVYDTRKRKGKIILL
ncbi:MAG: metallophosphoesterase [Candidatus Woesearchaeota archaeon]